MNITIEKRNEILKSVVYAAAKIWGSATEAEVQDSVNAAIKTVEFMNIDSSTDMLEAVYKATEAVHSAWVNNNLDRLGVKAQNGQLHQYLPCEFIGFEEFAKYVLFVQPVFEVLFEYSFDVQDLRAKYAEAVASYQNYHNVDFADKDEISDWLRGPIMKMQVPEKVYVYISDVGNATSISREVQERYFSDKS